MTFPGEALLTVELPNYEVERTLVGFLLMFLPVLWFVLIPSAIYQRTSQRLQDILSVLLPPLTVSAFLVSFVAVVLYLNPHNYYTLRRVFQAPLLTHSECHEILEMARVCAKRNVQQLGNSTPELLQEPVGWFKERDPIYPTTDLHFIIDPFTVEERSRVGQLLDKRLTPIVSRVYGIPPSALRVNDLFLVRYDAGKKVSLIPHTDNSDISFNILLNDNFTDGGTQFLERREPIQDSVPFALVQPQRGEFLMHASHILHEGYPISSGSRVIIVGFFSVDRMDPFGQATTKPATHLSWLSSWLSLHWLSVKLKDGYTFSDRRLEQNRGTIWDHVYLQSLRRDLVNLVKILGDALGTHELVRLVDPSRYDEYFQAMDTVYQGTSAVNWFRGQHVDVDLSGQVERQWVTRSTSPEKFRDTELPHTFSATEL